MPRKHVKELIAPFHVHSNEVYVSAFFMIKYPYHIYILCALNEVMVMLDLFHLQT